MDNGKNQGAPPEENEFLSLKSDLKNLRKIDAPEGFTGDLLAKLHSGETRPQPAQVFWLSKHKYRITSAAATILIMVSALVWWKTDDTAVRLASPQTETIVAPRKEEPSLTTGRSSSVTESPAAARRQQNAPAPYRYETKNQPAAVSADDVQQTAISAESTPSPQPVETLESKDRPGRLEAGQRVEIDKNDIPASSRMQPSSRTIVSDQQNTILQKRAVMRLKEMDSTRKMLRDTLTRLAKPAK